MDMADDYESMTVAQLKAALKEQDLPVSGNKAELIARLQEAAGVEAPAEAEEEAVVDTAEDDAVDAGDDGWDDELQVGIRANLPPRPGEPLPLKAGGRGSLGAGGAWLLEGGGQRQRE